MEQIPLFALRNKSNNHPVEIIEEREQVKAELNETFFFMPGERAEYLRCIVHVVLVSYLIDIKC